MDAVGSRAVGGFRGACRGLDARYAAPLQRINRSPRPRGSRPFCHEGARVQREGTRTISVESQRGWRGKENRCRTDTNERYRRVARPTVGPPRSLEHVAFFKLFRRGTPVTRNLTSTSIVIGRRRVTIPGDSRTSVGDIAAEETFLIQSMLN